jgi:hypothetical protein
VALALLLGAAASPLPAPAQEAPDADAPLAPASPYLHYRHPAYTEIDLLIERGVLTGLSPVVRPYHRGEVARALLLVDTLALAPLERRWVARLTREFAGEIAALADRSRKPALAFDIAAEGSARSQWHRDPLRPTGDGGTTGAAALDVRASMGIVALESHLRSDNYYLHDPQFPNRVAMNRLNQRAEDAYVEVQGRFMSAMVGRLYRNWGPGGGTQGLLLSDYPYSGDQASFRVGTPQISLTFLTGQLDDFPGDVHRYLAVHRLDFQPSDDLAFHVAEAVLYGGPNRNWDLAFMNPLSFWLTESDNLRDQRSGEANVLLSAGLWWRLRKSLVLVGDFLLDDVQVDGSNEPPSYAFYAGVLIPRLGQRTAARFSYSQVANLTYRSQVDYSVYTFRGVGLGRDVADCDLVTGQLDWYASSAVKILGRVEIFRRGEGGLDTPWPADPESAETILSGTVERTVRVALGGRARLGRWGVVEWEGGQNFVRNANHVDGAEDERFVGWIGLRLQGGWRTESR